MERHQLKQIKQIIFVGIFLGGAILIISGIYLVFLRSEPSCFDGRENGDETGVDCGGICLSCEIKTLAPLQAAWIKNFSVDKKSVIAAEIVNPNLNWGAKDFSYTFDIYDIYQNKIYSLTKKSFIYPDERKFLVEVNLSIEAKKIIETKLSFSEVNWKPKSEFPRPDIQIRGLETESAQPIKMGGLLYNNNPYSLSRLNAVGFLYNKKGVLISASKTEIGKTGAFEEKPFQIVFPSNIAASLIDESRTRIYVEAIR